MGKDIWKPGTVIYPVPAVMVSCGDMENKNIIKINKNKHKKQKNNIKKHKNKNTHKNNYNRKQNKKKNYETENIY